MIKEDLLSSWIKASLAFKANRFLNDASLNEMLVLKELIKNPNTKASQLCSYLNILKSQMSHLIENMKKKGYITSIKDENDERRMNLKVTQKGLNIFNREYASVLEFMSKVENTLGKYKTEELCKLLSQAANITKDLN